MERKAPKETKGKNTPFSARWKASLNHISFLLSSVTFLFIFFLLFPRKKARLHNLTSVQSKQQKKKTTTKYQWYDFQLQTAASKVRRVVGLNTSRVIHPRKQLYQGSYKTPVLLKDVIIKEDESDWLFNKQSTA